MNARQEFQKLKIILENFKIKEDLTRLKYERQIPYGTEKCKIDEQQKQIKDLAEQASKELEEIEKEKTETIKEYYKKQDEKISNMTDRELLETIYKNILNEIN